MSTGVKVEGFRELEHLLTNLAPREARNINRSAVHAMASRVVKQSRQNAPKDTGTLKKAIKAKRRRPRDPDKPFSDVMVEHGADARHDAFYWFMVERGTVDQPARPFIKPAVEELRANVQTVYREEFINKYRAYLKRKAKRLRGV